MGALKTLLKPFNIIDNLYIANKLLNNTSECKNVRKTKHSSTTTQPSPGWGRNFLTFFFRGGVGDFFQDSHSFRFNGKFLSILET